VTAVARLKQYLGPFTRVASSPPTQSTTAAFCRHRSPGSACRLLAAELFYRPGMTSRKTWHHQTHWPHCVVSSRHTCSGSLFLATCICCRTSTDCLWWT